MKKMLLALVAIFAIATISNVSAGFGYGRRGCNTGCATPVAACPATPVVPKCFKTIEVPAIQRNIKQAPICERIPQPDKVVWHAQPDIIVYECPSDCNTGCN